MQCLKRFFMDGLSSGTILIVASCIAMLLANLDFTNKFYYSFLQITIGFHIGTLEINKNIIHWINEALMSVFFLLIGLEIKCELIKGSFSKKHQLLFPVLASIGGMVMPIIIYLLCNYKDPIARHGWAIPVATDITFVLGILELLGKKVPVALRLFLMSLAIIDDIGAIIIIALFYKNQFSLFPLCTVFLIITILISLNIINIYKISIYMLIGIILWIAMLKSGLQTTITGVIIGLIIPLKEEDKELSVELLKNTLRPWVKFLILPLFAFSNAGIPLSNAIFKFSSLSLPVGIIGGLFICKPLGISFFCWLSMKIKLIKFPRNLTWKEIIAGSILCGIGFTMSVFIATLAFEREYLTCSKFSILIGSLLSSITGYYILKQCLLAKQT